MTTKERPIIMGPESISAILAGRKTQTRRVIEPQPEYNAELEMWTWPDVLGGYGSCYPEEGLKQELPRLCPYGQPGDRLWVREGYRLWLRGTEVSPGFRRFIQYKDDSESVVSADFYEWFDLRERGSRHYMKRSPIHMPRWASRITLEVVGVRAERLQEITIDDLIAEGWDVRNSEPWLGGTAGADARAWYAALWDRLNPQYPWASNPWVWVVEFRRAS